MGLYSFQPRFVDAVLAGTKRHTIRATRKYPDKVGSIARLQTGARMKPVLLFYAPVIKVEMINILKCSNVSALPSGLRVVVNAHLLSDDEKDRLFIADGFPGGAVEAAAFWADRLETGSIWHGHIYYWDFDKRVMER